MKRLNVRLRPTTHRERSLTGEMNPPYSLIPLAATPRTARTRCVTLLIAVGLAVLMAVSIAACNSDSAGQPSGSPSAQTPASPTGGQTQTSPTGTPSERPQTSEDTQRETTPPQGQQQSSGWDAIDLTAYSMPDILLGEYYYLDGDNEEMSLYFWDDGTVDIEDGDDYEEGEYTIHGSEMTITGQDGEVTLRIQDIATIESEYGDVFALEDSMECELILDEYYHLNADEEAVSLYFWDDGDVDIEYWGGSGFEDMVGTYTVVGFQIIIDLDGSLLELEIINSYVLEAVGEQYVFVLVP